MSSPPGAAWQQPDLAVAFLDQRRVLIPLLEVQEEVVRSLLERRGRAVERFLDLGSGDGAMAELILSLQPDAEGVLVDFSQPMLDRVADRLKSVRGRWQAIFGDLSDPAWSAGLPDGHYDLAISCLAIHHLPAERKRALFGELFALLGSGGMFVNLDYVLVHGPLQGMFDEQMVRNLVRAERERGSARPAEEIERDWADDGQEDRPDTVEDQLLWLREAGFVEGEVHFKWADLAVFGAVRPDEGGRR